MKCRQCHDENREGAGFCLECGGKLDAICKSCGKLLPKEVKFCDQCGEPVHTRKDSLIVDYCKPLFYTPKYLAEKIPTSPSTMEREPEPVTVMFADRTRSVSLSEKLEPEEIRLDPWVPVS